MTIRLPPAHSFFHFFQPVQLLMQSVVLLGEVKAYQAVHIFLKKTGAGNRAHADPFGQFFAKIRMRKVSDTKIPWCCYATLVRCQWCRPAPKN
jgi:hypothetical protein